LLCFEIAYIEIKFPYMLFPPILHVSFPILHIFTNMC
jgi:hypothetical protein